MTILLSPRREPIKVELPSGRSVSEFDVGCGRNLPDDRGAAAGLLLIRIQADELAGPAYAPTKDLDHFAEIMRRSAVVVIFPAFSGLDAEAIATEVAQYLGSARVMVVVECAPTAGLAWIVFTLRIMGPAAVVVPVFPVPRGYNDHAGVLH